jgi:hypothetical protein
MLLLTKYYSVKQIEDEVGEACGTDGGENVYRILANKSEGKGHLENLGIDGSLILKWMGPVVSSCVHDH